MRIAFFADSYRPYTSGVVRSIETFTEDLRRQGHRVFIFAPDYKGCQPEEDVFRFASIPAPTNQDFSLAIPFSPSLGPTLRRLKVDLVHVHSPFLLGRAGAVWARRFDLPLVYTYHTLYDQYVHYVPFARSLSARVLRYVSREFCNRCDLVITPTGVIRDRLKQWGVTAPLEVIPTGIRLEEFHGGDPHWLCRQYGFDPGDEVLVSVGRLGPEKNIEFLLRSFALVLERRPQARLVLVGSGPYEESYRRLAEELGLGARVTFTGKLGKQEVAHCLAGARLFVFASLTETQGLVIGEAHAAGLPAVVVRAFGAAEMVRDGEDGYLCAASHAEFSQRVLELLQDEGLRARMGASARRNAEEFSAERSARRLAEAYGDVLEGHCSRAGCRKARPKAFTRPGRAGR